MVGVLSMAAAAETSTVTVPPIVTGNKHRPSQSHRPASGDGSGTGITGFAPASEHKRHTANWPGLARPIVRRVFTRQLKF